MDKIQFRRSPALRFLRQRRGAVAVMTALLVPALIGFAGIAGEVGLWYAFKRQNQSAADEAAISGATEIRDGQACGGSGGVTAGTASADIQGLAKTASGYNGFSAASPNTITVNCPPQFGSYAGNTKAVEVILTQHQNTLFAAFALPSVTITNRAVATVEQQESACILALETAGKGISFTGNYSLLEPNCTVVSDSTSSNAVDGVGNGCIEAYTLATPGGYSFTGNSVSPCSAEGLDLTTAQVSQSVANPYAGTLTHAFMTAGMPTPAAPPTSSCGTPSETVVNGVVTYTYTGNCEITKAPSKGLPITCTVNSGPPISFTGICGAIDITTANGTPLNIPGLQLNGVTLTLSAPTTITGALSAPGGTDTVNLPNGTQITGGVSFIGNGTFTLGSGALVDGGLSFSGNDTVDLGGGTQIDGGASFTGNETANLSPGTYWFTDGSLTAGGNSSLGCTTCSPGGAGVTLIFTTTKTTGGTIGTLNLTGNATNTLNAPSTGTYAGYLMLQDTVPSATYLSSSGTIGNYSYSSTFSGLIYFPSTNLNFVGNINYSSNCLVAVANQFTLTGNIQLNSTGCPAGGLNIVPTVLSNVVLVE